jgi:hypothetical protein
MNILTKPTISLADIPKAERQARIDPTFSLWL